VEVPKSLFIFNFKLMIRKTLIVFLLLTMGYQCLLWLLPSFGSFQHQWQENKVIAERYLYGPRQETVILGTSLATRLDMQQLPGVYKMTFGGLGIFDGLALLLAKDSLPSRVFIETNFLLRQPNAALLGSLQNPWEQKLKRHFSILRSEKQPFGMVIEGVKVLRRWVKGEALQKTHIPNVRTDTAQIEAYSVDTPLMRGDFFAYMMQMEAQKFAQAPDSTRLHAQVALLQSQLAALHALGVRVYLFEMPIEQELQELAVPTAIREALHKAFANNPDITLLPAFDGRYYTEDGLHLGWKEAERFTKVFRNYIKKAP